MAKYDVFGLVTISVRGRVEASSEAEAKELALGLQFPGVVETAHHTDHIRAKQWHISGELDGEVVSVEVELVRGVEAL